MRLFLIGILVLVCSADGLAQVREEIRLKLANGSSLVVDEANETPQGVWYRQGTISNFLPKEKIKKVERIKPEPAPVQQTTNDDDHFEVTEAVAETTAPKSGNYDQPVWIYLK